MTIMFKEKKRDILLLPIKLAGKMSKGDDAKLKRAITTRK